MSAPGELVDVTLLLEGTYPYIRGGVSSWVHQLIEGLPELCFGLVFLGARREDYGEPKYEVPGNVQRIQCHYLMDLEEIDAPARCVGNPGYLSEIGRLHDWFCAPDTPLEEGLVDRVLLQLGKETGIRAEEFFYSEAVWSHLKERYSRSCPEAPFISYFWTVRNTHAPLIKVARLAGAVPPSRVFHTVSTGHAGLLGAILRRKTGRPLVLTEHGIYTRERQIDLRSLFLREQEAWWEHPSESGLEYHHQLWLKLYEGISRLSYASADPIIALFEQNRQRQIRDGADPQQTRVIPNGIDVARFVPLRDQRPEEIPLVLGLIGRVVPIKDIKTFIRAIRALTATLPGVQGWIIGPEEEDPDYVRQCKELVESLQLEQEVQFLGFQNVQDMLPRLGLLVLTSISEAFPLVIVEAFASGLPVVATDVGACREIIEGRDAEDRAIGPAGATVPIADAEAMARAAHALLSNPDRWKSAQQAGIERVERFYAQRAVIDRYREIYQDAMGA